LPLAESLRELPVELVRYELERLRAAPIESSGSLAALLHHPALRSGLRAR
jgi:hypothetical protein